MQKTEFDHEQYRTWTQRFILTAKGFTMGAADIIPGVSGGTIALISGIYEHLITALSTPAPKHIIALLTLPFWIGNAEKRTRNIEILSEIPFIFLIFLGTGILLGILSMSRMIPFFMDHYPFQTYSFFFGLIVFSITIPYSMMDHGWKEWSLLALFTAGTFWLVTTSPYEKIPVQVEWKAGADSGEKKSAVVRTDVTGSFLVEMAAPPEQLILRLPEHGGEVIAVLNRESTVNRKEYRIESNTTGYDLLLIESKRTGVSASIKGYLSARRMHTFSIGDFAWIWFTGAVAICAMILPGISGAYILVLLGEYRFILQSLHERNFAVIAVFVFGVATGLLSFVHLLKYLLKRYHSLTMAALTGFLVGSLGKIWPFLYLDGSPQPLDCGISAGIAGAGGLLLFLLERLSSKLKDPDPPLKQ
jgi:uncharacterized membrane protein